MSLLFLRVVIAVHSSFLRFLLNFLLFFFLISFKVLWIIVLLKLSKKGSCPEGSVNPELWYKVVLFSSVGSVWVVSWWKKYFSLSLLLNSSISCRSFAGCSFLGVGMKFNPLDSRDVSPGVNLCLLNALMIWVWYEDMVWIPGYVTGYRFR